MKRELVWLILAWLALAAILFAFSRPDLPVPGLYYDEAVYGHFTKDIFHACAAEPHMPGSQTVNFFGRPLPLFVQGYLGAVKCWMLLPFFAVFGPGAVVMRVAMLLWTLIGLLSFMLWAWRLLGLPAAVLGGFLLGLDPSFLFFSVWEWGSVVPSFVCRFAGFFFLLAWWRRRRAVFLFLAGLAFGIGFFNKIDFAVVLLGSGLAALAVFRKEIIAALRQSLGQLALSALGFVFGAAPALWYLPRTIRYVLFSGEASEPGEAEKKIDTFYAMFDGSYCFRLLARGGDLPRPIDHWSAILSPFGFVFVLSVLFALIFVLLTRRKNRGKGNPATQASIGYSALLSFLLLSSVLILFLTWLLPSANRIHHWTLVYPFPQLLILSSALWLFRFPSPNPTAQSTRVLYKLIAAVALLAVIAGHAAALLKTRRLITETGGRGHWSASLDAFAREVRTRSDLTLVSMDWGFQEQLALLTEGPRLLEPIWQMQSGLPFQISTATNYIYLLHSPEYRVFSCDDGVLNLARSRDPSKVSIREHKDRQGKTDFFTVQFLGD